MGRRPAIPKGRGHGQTWNPSTLCLSYFPVRLGHAQWLPTLTRCRCLVHLWITGIWVTCARLWFSATTLRHAPVRWNMPVFAPCCADDMDHALPQIKNTVGSTILLGLLFVVDTSLILKKEGYFACISSQRSKHHNQRLNRRGKCFIGGIVGDWHEGQHGVLLPLTPPSRGCGSRTSLGHHAKLTV